MTRLTALQIIMERAGLNPPSAVETSGGSDVARANTLLDRENVNVQSRGWTFNRITNATLFKDANGNITVPDTAIVVRSADTNTDEIIVSIGGTLYNLAPDENTAVFTEDQKTDYHLLWKFECVPHPIQRYIAESAAMQFIQLAADRLRNVNWRMANARERMAKEWADACRYDNWQRRPNVLKTAEANRFRGYRPTVMRGEIGY